VFLFKLNLRQQQTTDGTDAAQNVYFYFSVHNDGKQKSIYPPCHTTKPTEISCHHEFESNPSLASEKELMIHPIIDRYTDTIRFIVVIGGASLFDLHICVQTCK